MRRPLCEVVNWNHPYAADRNSFLRRPLCGVVNWNAGMIAHFHDIRVDLYVRSWIEISWCWILLMIGSSTSMWGRELKYPQIWSDRHTWSSTSMWGRELKYKFSAMRLFLIISRPLCEVVNWNRYVYCQFLYLLRRPLCEVVNWNYFWCLIDRDLMVDLYVRSWIEISN